MSKLELRVRDLKTGDGSVVGFDDLHRLTRKHVQDWIETLIATEVAPGKKMAPMTIAQALLKSTAAASLVDRGVAE